jgi:DNA-binding SARP family transcriptional activator
MRVFDHGIEAPHTQSLLGRVLDAAERLSYVYDRAESAAQRRDAGPEQSGHDVSRLIGELHHVVALARRSIPRSPAPAQSECSPAERLEREAMPDGDEMPQRASIVARLLSPFQLQVSGNTIRHWPNGKAKSVFKYLLLRRGHPAPREKVMELFWPDAEPEAARNSLNVAIHRIRRELSHADPEFPFVLLREGCYLLNPSLRVWTDTDAFTKHFERAAELHRRGRHAEAMREYAACESLYENELLAEDSASVWLMPLRQQFRDRYLAVLDRLSRHYFDQDEFGACLMLCTKMTAVDACNESAHRLLMRCYAKLEQLQLAEGQYRSCVQALAREVCIPPSTETTELYRQIARREAV